MFFLLSVVIQSCSGALDGQWFVKISDIKDTEGQKGPRELLMHHLLQMF